MSSRCFDNRNKHRDHVSYTRIYSCPLYCTCTVWCMTVYGFNQWSTRPNDGSWYNAFPNFSASLHSPLLEVASGVSRGSVIPPRLTSGLFVLLWPGLLYDFVLCIINPYGGVLAIWLSFHYCAWCTHGSHGVVVHDVHIIVLPHFSGLHIV